MTFFIAFWYSLAVATFVILPEPISCLECISCRCGSSNKNYTHCIERETKEKYTCNTWVHCQTCKGNTTHCITCPPKRFGPHCGEDAVQVSRRKRQISTGPSTHCANEGSLHNGRITVIRSSTQPLLFEEEDFQLPVGTRLHYSCDIGFVLEGSALLVCTDKGYWSEEKPSCVEDSSTKCSDPGQISNGSYRNSDGTSASSQEYRVGQLVVYNCQIGYELVGSREVTCMPSGSWSSKPSCRKSSGDTNPLGPADSNGNCRDPGSIQNGYRRRSSTNGVSSRSRIFSHGQSLRYFCNQGYELQGNNEITCLTGQWSSNTPRCSEKNPTLNCNDPGSIINGFRRSVIDIPSTVTGTYSNGQSFRFFCDYGYELRGDSILTCLPSGMWSSGTPTCQAVSIKRRRKREAKRYGSTQCMNEGPIQHGRMHVRRVLTAPLKYVDDFEFPVGTRLRYSCDKGYKLQGAADQVCEDNGYWSDEKPYCIEIKCRRFGPILNGRVVVYFTSMFKRWKTIDQERGLNYPVGTSLGYACDNGYVLQGNKILHCEATGEWSAEEPKCIKGAEEHKRNRRQIEKNYGASFCINYGTIDIRYITVIPPKNLSQGFFEDEFPVGTRLHFSCKEGYVLKGTATLTCEDTGYWSEEMPSCIKVSFERNYGCINAGTIQHGGVTVIPPSNFSQGFIENDFELAVGTRLHFSCRKGYVLQGTATLTCEDTGYWSEEIPNCIEGTEEHKRIQRQISDEKSYGSSYCTNDGTIHNGRVTVIRAKNILRRTVDLDFELPVGTRLLFSCRKGYVLQGAATLTCKDNGYWSELKPSCIEVKCKKCGPVLNGRMVVYFTSLFNRRRTIDEESCPEYPAGTRLSYECDYGYVLSGNKTLYCESTGNWSSNDPVCIKECGVNSVYSNPPIFSGTNTSFEEWPWTVAIADINNDTTKFLCSGVLLDDKTILTVAHCVEGVRDYAIYFGLSQLNFDSQSRLTSKRISSQVVIHPNFNNQTLDNDIALIMFQPPVRYSDVIQPICLPTQESSARNLIAGENGFVSGWETGIPFSRSQNLSIIKISVLPEKICNQHHRLKDVNLTISPGMFCANLENNTDGFCNLASGSPMVFYNKEKDTYTLEGLVTWKENPPCQKKENYYVLTRVGTFLQWILENWHK